MRSKGAWPTSRGLLLSFWDPLYIYGMDKARDFKFSAHIDRQVYKPEMQNESRGASPTSRDLLL